MPKVIVLSPPSGPWAIRANIAFLIILLKSVAQ